MSDCKDIVKALQNASSRKYLDNLPRFAIDHEGALGVPVPEIRKIARAVPSGKAIALELWETGIHEAMILATMVFPSRDLTFQEAGKMVEDIKSWDICDHFTGNLVANSPIAVRAITSWCSQEGEFVRRAAFSTIAQLEHKKAYAGENLELFLHSIKDAARDPRNFVKKAVLWALVEIGKSSIENNSLAIEASKEISAMDSKPAKWIARTALKELTSGKVIERLGKLSRQ